jgi:uncharacterized membrane protein YgaE (UPF0421/DUF939 family)
MNEVVFWTIIGALSTAVGGLYLFLFNMKGEVTKCNGSLNDIVKIFENFMQDRKEKDKEYYKWKDEINEVRSQHKMMTRAKNIIKSHNLEDE